MWLGCLRWWKWRRVISALGEQFTIIWLHISQRSDVTHLTAVSVEPSRTNGWLKTRSRTFVTCCIATGGMSIKAALLFLFLTANILCQFGRPCYTLHACRKFEFGTVTLYDGMALPFFNTLKANLTIADTFSPFRNIYPIRAWNRSYLVFADLNTSYPCHSHFPA